MNYSFIAIPRPSHTLEMFRPGRFATNPFNPLLAAMLGHFYVDAQHFKLSFLDSCIKATFVERSAIAPIHLVCDKRPRRIAMMRCKYDAVSAEIAAWTANLASSVPMYK